MIQLDEITLRRFKSHEDKTIQFKPGVNAIVGPNGSGKSSILQAIDFALTGQSEENKEDLITKGSLGSSFVKVKFTLNGKPGEIERHLDSSKVILKYDGETKNKSTEVKELWAKLLQIDSHIFKHVIIAHQKRVPELFAGESSVREKAFQKIFLVPNTEKIRTTIWNNYINTAPPLLPVEDVQELQAKITDVSRKLVPLEHKVEVLSTAILSEPQVVSVLNSIEYYKKCLKDAENRPKLETTVEDIKSKVTLLRAKEAELVAKLEKTDIATLTTKQRDLVHRRALFSVKMQRTEELNKFKAAFDLLQENLEQTQKLYDEAKRQEDLYWFDFSKLHSEEISLTAELCHFTDVKGHDKCPTCKQSLNDVAKFVEELELKRTKCIKDKEEAAAKHEAARVTSSGYCDTLMRYGGHKEKIESLEKELANYKDIEFDYKELEQIDTDINTYRTNATELESLRLTLNKLEIDLTVANGQLSSLTHYEGTATAAEELSIMNEVIGVNRERNTELQRVRLEIVQLQTELSMLNQRMATTMTNIDKNAKREAYIEKLKTMYDTLHTTQFPRKLIQTYSTIVEEELLLNLQRFNIPYTPRIDDGFKINMVNATNHIIPTLSGGQEMIVGLCLRLALHSMFSQSFPMLIIDEGTTHLDVENAKLYFNCIKELRRDQVIKQLIIIDHNPALADVVDHVIHTSV